MPKDSLEVIHVHDIPQDKIEAFLGGRDALIGRLRDVTLCYITFGEKINPQKSVVLKRAKEEARKMAENLWVRLLKIQDPFPAGEVTYELWTKQGNSPYKEI